jgi:hypothetical protein
MSAFKTFIILLFCTSTYAQVLNIDCDSTNVITALNTPDSSNIVVVDELMFSCAKILLIQDNAVLYVFSLQGTGKIIRGGKGGAPTVNGIDRFEGDANPMIVLIGCEGEFNNLEIGENIDIVKITDWCNNN